MASRLSRSEMPPQHDDPVEERRERQRQLVLGYRLFGALRWGDTGDGHISARDPERTDHFWLLGYGVPFNHAAAEDLVLVSPSGEVVEGRHEINPTAHYIHTPIHEARPDVVSAAHTHTQWGTPFAAQARRLEPITQEACAFHGDHALFDDEEVNIASTDGGKRIAVALGAAKAVILRNHGLLTVGASVGEAVGWFVLLERAAEAAVKSPSARPISDHAAEVAHATMDSRRTGWHVFRWLVDTHGVTAAGDGDGAPIAVGPLTAG
jgi:ribulose-5-phosphate 4-epimerase/fuculose-1-phosphate aldolase